MTQADIQILKQSIIEFLYDSGNKVIKRNNNYYVTKCPFCGDESSSGKLHFYIKIVPDDNSGIVYYCFRCIEGGLLNSSILSLMGCDNEKLLSRLDEFNNVCSKGRSTKLENVQKVFSFQIPDYKPNIKHRYITYRLGVPIDEATYDKLKIVTSIKDFLKLNKLKPRGSTSFIDLLDKYYVGFLSYGNSHILLRDITEKQKYRWIKYPIIEESTNNRLFYVMQGQMDVLSTEPININISEGIFDIISVCYQLGHNTDHDINIAATGKYYDTILNTLISMGLVGGNITINIFSDNDLLIDPTAKNTTTVGFFKNKLHSYRYLYNKINIYYNTYSKDFGVKKENIKIRKYII